MGTRSMAHRKKCANRWIGAGIAHKSDSQARDFTIGCATEFGVLNLAPAVREGFHVITAGRNPHDWATGSDRRRSNNAVLGVDPGFPTEPATDLWRNNTDAPFGHRESRGDLLVKDVWHLSRSPQGEPTMFVDLSGCAVRLHGDHGKPLVHVAPAHEVVSIVEVGTRLVGLDHGLV